jgi:hypothetical protein
MKTEFGALTYETNFYDLYKSDDTYILSKIDEARKKAKEYLKGKKRNKYYPVYGIDECSDKEVCYLIELSDYEVERIKAIIVDEYNKFYEDEDNVPYDTDIYELCKEFPLNELDDNTELDNLLFHRAPFLMPSAKDLEISAIDFKKRKYMYEIQIITYDISNHSILSTNNSMIDLDDEQYIYMLSERLLIKEQFNYNRLILTNPKLAQHITDIILENNHLDYLTECYPPFVVIFKEINEDAAKILYLNAIENSVSQ